MWGAGWRRTETYTNISHVGYGNRLGVKGARSPPPSVALEWLLMSTHRDPQAPPSAPDFLLSRAHGSIRTQGCVESFTDAWEAVEALREGRVNMVVGALPFERDKPAALTVPESIIREEGPLEPHAFYRYGPGSVLNARVAGVDPSPEEHLDRVDAAITTIANTSLKKVVLARAVDIEFSPAVDARLVAARLIDNSYNRDGFITDLSPAGPEFEGRMFVGSSPEVLIKRQGSTVSAYPLAGPHLAHRTQMKMPARHVPCMKAPRTWKSTPMWWNISARLWNHCVNGWISRCGRN